MTRNWVSTGVAVLSGVVVGALVAWIFLSMDAPRDSVTGGANEHAMRMKQHATLSATVHDANQTRIVFDVRVTTTPLLQGNSSLRRPRVFDCIMFNGEFDLLEIRLLALAGLVDYFVVVESTTTFSGMKKPAFLADVLVNNRRPLISAFRAQILLVSFDMPADLRDAWAREHASREAKRQGLNQLARPDDWVILSDIDEFPDAAMTKRVLAGEWGDSVVLQCDFHFYHGGWTVDQMFGGPSFHRVGELVSPGSFLQAFRSGVISRDHACWHCSYCFGPSIEDAIDQIVRKMESFSHQELNQPPFTDRDYLRQRIHAGKAPFAENQPMAVDPLSNAPDPVKYCSQYSYLRGEYTHEEPRDFNKLPPLKN